MTSSHFADHQLAHRCDNVAHRCDSQTLITFAFPDKLLSQLVEVASFQERSLQDQLLFLCRECIRNNVNERHPDDRHPLTPCLDSSYASGVSVPKEEGCLTAVHSASTDNTSSAVQAVPEQAHSDTHDEINFANIKKEDCQGLLKNNPLLTSREKGTNPRAKCTSPRTKNDPFARKTLSPDLIPDDLQHISELIREFWSVKKGVRSESRWKRLLKKLRAYKPQEQVSMLEDAANSGWGDLFPRQQASASRFNKPAEPETAHPASKVFKASDLDWPDRTHETLPKIEGMPDIKNILPDF